MNKNNKNLPVLFGLGMICLMLGLVSFYVEQCFSIPMSALVILGIVTLVICFIRQGRPSHRHFKLSQWKKTGIMALSIFLLAVWLIGINYASQLLPWRWDVTQAKQHTLTASTIELVEGLQADIQLTAFYVGIPPKYLEDLFKEYERISKGMIKAEIIDPIRQIGYAAQFGSVIDGKENKAIVQSGNERRNIDFTEEPLTEAALTNAIVRVTREERHIYFLDGHGELSFLNEGDQGLSLFAKLLDSNNMVSHSLMLGTTAEIPEDCDVLIIAGPRNELDAKEEAVIEEYLKKGGDALFLVEHVIVTTPDKPLTDDEKHKNPSLNSMLNKWGINVNEDVVVDLNSHVGSDVGSPATKNYMPHPAITQGLDYTFYIRPRSVSVLKEHRKTIKIAPIVLTATKENSWGETNRTLEIYFDKGVDGPGPVPISAVVWEGKEEGDRSDTRIIVFTDADFLTNIFIDKYSNAEMGLNIVNWLSELDYKVFMDDKEINVERLDLTSKQKRKIVVVLFLIPVFIAASGIYVWMKGRK